MARYEIDCLRLGLYPWTQTIENGKYSKKYIYTDHASQDSLMPISITFHNMLDIINI